LFSAARPIGYGNPQAKKRVDPADYGAPNRGSAIEAATSTIGLGLSPAGLERLSRLADAVRIVRRPDDQASGILPRGASGIQTKANRHPSDSLIEYRWWRALQSDMTELDDRQGDRRERTGYSGALDLTPSAPPAVNDTPIAPARQTRSDGQERPIFT
jgi:hypothetical protein